MTNVRARLEAAVDEDVGTEILGCIPERRFDSAVWIGHAVSRSVSNAGCLRADWSAYSAIEETLKEETR